jgi:hypothetical protein
MPLFTPPFFLLAYRNKILHSNYWDWRNLIPKNYTHTPREKRVHPDYPTFLEFLDHLIYQDKLDVDGDIDVHVRQYWHQCDMCNIPYTIVGKLETMGEDTAYIMEKTNMSDPLAATPRLNPSGEAKSQAEVAMRYFAELPREMLERLVETFRFEFEAFGYDFRPYLRK